MFETVKVWYRVKYVAGSLWVRTCIILTLAPQFSLQQTMQNTFQTYIYWHFIVGWFLGPYLFVCLQSKICLFHSFPNSSILLPLVFVQNHHNVQTIPRLKHENYTSCGFRNQTKNIKKQPFRAVYTTCFFYYVNLQGYHSPKKLKAYPPRELTYPPF